MRFVDALYDNDANDIGSRMSSETRVIVTLSYDLLDEVETYRHRHRIPSRTEAIRRMLLTTAILDQRPQPAATAA
jgi:metal-responsive CopG/Arc/MetJ family transcriptional regulator